jgi:alpha-beta hydrolase superfamily lysophospholipase
MMRPSVREEISLRSSAAAWLTLRLHAVVPERMSPCAALVLHGATLPGFIFDLPVPGASFQERLAATGLASYALDARGYGRSTRPVPGGAGWADDQPFARANEVVDDVADAVRYLREVRGHPEVALIGFSWGSVCAGSFASRFGDQLDRLVLCAPIHACRNERWLQGLRDPADPTRCNRALGAYRWTTAEGLRARWDADIPPADRQAWRAPDVLDAVLANALANDPLSATRSPPAFRAPNGSFADLFEAFSGRAVFDASRIRAPTLLLRGEADTTASDDDARGLLQALGSINKHYQVIAAGGHFQCLERSMPRMIDACAEFLLA